MSHFFFFFAPGVLAGPLGGPARRQVENNSDGSSEVSAKIWAPILVVVLLLVALAILTWSKRGWRRGLASLTGGASAASGVTVPTGANGTRELTADQLAGGTTGGGTQGRTAAARTGRTRRTRRTPSQISTTSLPAYMKEPGDQELVIFRGPEDMEDANPAPTTVVMPPVEEDDVEGPFPSVDVSEASIQDTQPDLSTQRLVPSGEMATRRSVDTSSEESSLLQGDASIPSVPDPRGEAPPYFEVIPSESETSAPPSIPENVTTSPGAAQGAAQSSIASRRRSGFRSLFSALSPSAIRPPVPPPAPASQDVPNHARTDSVPSVHSASSEASRTRSHRPSHSGGSNLTQSMFRSISRQRSNNTLGSNHLTSQSMISLNSISSPLSHTLVRTEITYPRSGPTPEQVRLISSRESFAKFGKPYGADAIAFAASTSMQELNPPPGFDAPSPDPNSAAGTSGRSHSALSSSLTDEVLSDESSGGVQLDQANRREESQSPESSTHTTDPETEPDSASSAPAIKEGHTDSSVEPIQERLGDTNGTTSSAPSAQLTSLPLPKAQAPPTSFRLPSASMRSDSRASSVTSFATAAESMTDPSTPTSDVEFETPHPSEPSTPRLMPQHPRDGTDTTIATAVLPAAQTVV